MRSPTNLPSPRAAKSATQVLFPLAIALFASGFTGGSCGPIEEPEPLPPAPEPLACRLLAEDACVARGDCTALFDQACACPACLPGERCPPCDCIDEPAFSGCQDNDPCAGLSEAACNADPACEAIYSFTGCPEIVCEDDANCEPVDCPTIAGFYECQERQPEPPVCDAVACLLYCEYGFATGPDGCEICECNPEPPPPPMCEPVLCQIACEYGFQVDDNGCEICACNPEPPPPPMCEPVLCEIYCEYGFQVDANGCEICACNPAPGQCQTDADCPNGYCEHYATCAGLDCPPPPPSQCIYPSCDDGHPIVCDALPPMCEPGEVVAARGGCFDCVDARTCR